jgi:2-polyprenyl-3-methyl-5-hydroxy-6-metoxy-1,4-benzoquinol methylase
MKSIHAFLRARGNYSSDDERRYYEHSKEDRASIPYQHLTQYVKGSVGTEFFRDKAVLDVGCGEGVYSAWIADLGGAESVLGVELTEHRIRREYEITLARLQFVSGDVFDIALPKEKFDVVFANLVLHHLRFRLYDILRIVWDSLRSGGQFLAFEPNVYSPIAIVAHLMNDRSANEGFLSPHQVSRALTACGFDDVRVGYFWRDRAWARNPLFGSSFWIQARKPGSVR